MQPKKLEALNEALLRSSLETALIPRARNMREDIKEPAEFWVELFAPPAIPRLLFLPLARRFQR